VSKEADPTGPLVDVSAWMPGRAERKARAVWAEQAKSGPSEIFIFFYLFLSPLFCLHILFLLLVFNFKLKFIILNMNPNMKQV
jgi:hypothetical protein